MTAIRIITLTPAEAEIVRHRIEVPDAMADVFSDIGDGNDWGLTEHDEIMEFITDVLAETCSNGPRGAMTISFDPEKAGHTEILKELLEGNIMGHFAADGLEFDRGTPEHNKGLNLRAVIRRVEAKFAAAGIDASIPGC